MSSIIIYGQNETIHVSANDITNHTSNFSYKKRSETEDCISLIDSLTGRKIYQFVDRMPSPKDGEAKLLKKLKEIKLNNIPEHIQTKIIVEFIVDSDGKIFGKRVIKNIEGTDLAEQVLKIIDDIEWTIGTCNGSQVPVIYTLPVILEFK